MENPIKMDGLGYPYFRKPPYCDHPSSSNSVKQWPEKSVPYFGGDLDDGIFSSDISEMVNLYTKLLLNSYTPPKFNIAPET